MAYYTTTDIIIRNTMISDYIASYAEKIADNIDIGAQMNCHVKQLKLLVAFSEIISCYPVYGTTYYGCCLSEAQMDNIFEQVQKITNLCFPPKGQSYLDPCYLLLEDGNVVLWENFGKCELETCNS